MVPYQYGTAVSFGRGCKLPIERTHGGATSHVKKNIPTLSILAVFDLANSGIICNLDDADDDDDEPRFLPSIV